MNDWQDFVPLFSLGIALASVIVGPLISWRIAKQQINSAVVIANKQVISPIRQAWIEHVRQKMSEILNVTLRLYTHGSYYNVDTESEEDREKDLDKTFRRLEFVCTEIELMMNPDDEDQQVLIKNLRQCCNIAMDRNHATEFPDLHIHTTELCVALLKREWKRVKGGE